MAYRTINIKPETYERLRAYKVGGMSFDEVVQFLMERVDPGVLHERARAAAPRTEPIRFAKLDGNARAPSRR